MCITERCVHVLASAAPDELSVGEGVGAGRGGHRPCSAVGALLLQLLVAFQLKSHSSTTHRSGSLHYLLLFLLLIALCFR